MTRWQWNGVHLQLETNPEKNTWFLCIVSPPLVYNAEQDHLSSFCYELKCSSSQLSCASVTTLYLRLASFDAFTANTCNKFSGANNQRFGDWLCLHHQSPCEDKTTIKTHKNTFSASIFWLCQLKKRYLITLNSLCYS